MQSQKQSQNLLDEVIEAPIGTSPRVDPKEDLLVPYGNPEVKFTIERRIEVDFNFLPGAKRCGSENNNRVAINIRCAANTRDSQGFVFDNAVLSDIHKALNGAYMSTSCEELAIFVVKTVVNKASVPLKWVSVGIESDFPGMIVYNWKEREEIPAVELKRLICNTEAAALRAAGHTVYEIEAPKASPIHRGCR